MRKLSSSNLIHLIESYSLISKSLSSEETLRNIMNEAADLLDGQGASIFLFDNTTNELFMKVATNLSPNEMKEIRVPMGKGIVGYVAEKGELVNTKNTQDDKRFYDKIDAKTGMKTVSCLTAPLTAGDKIIGAAQVINKKKEKYFDEEDELLFGEFAKLASLTLNKSFIHEQIVKIEKMETDLEIASSIQSNLLPENKLVVNSYEFNGFYKPAKYVGGDYFDFFQIADNEIFFTIGDVTGKGAHASLLMASVEAFLSASFEYRHSLADVVFKLNNFFHKKTPEGIFVTMFFGILNTDAKELTYINAGHPAPIIIKGNEKVLNLEATDVVLGVMKNWKYEVKYAELKPDDIFLAYTDGISEAQNSKMEMFGLERILELALERSDNPQSLLEYIPEQLEEFSRPKPQADDISLLLISKA